MEPRAQLQTLVEALLIRACARTALVYGRRALLAAAGDLAIVDPVDPSALVAGVVQAGGSGETDELWCPYRGAPGATLHLRLLERRAVLCLIFDRRTTAGLVRLRLRDDAAALASAVAALGCAPMTDDEIDALFGGARLQDMSR
ncbi:MAG: hypothetical protein KC636_16095 [Myxococcales bacterium]|nr:hypothetical protein [Myxococcales bacterium]